MLFRSPRVTALTGIDAISHALETYVTNRRNAASLSFSREAWKLLAENFPKVLEKPGEIEPRAGMQLGACFAGMAIENSMLGATHALANPLTAEYGLAHGQAIGIMLPHVIRFNGQEVSSWYEELLGASAMNGLPTAREGVAGLANFVQSLVVKAGLPVRLSNCGVDVSRLPELAALAAKQWTGHFNPRPVSEMELLELYRLAF